MMKIQINKISILVLASALILGCKTKTSPSHEGEVFVKVVTVKVGNGWGYQIYQDTSLYINQPFVPVIPGGKPFATEELALKAGRIVLDRVTKQKSPALDSTDLINIGVIPK